MTALSTKPFFVFKRRESLLVLLSLFLVSKHVEAQSPPVVFKNFSVNDGLSHNFVRGIFQDSRGFIWISTIDGLNKFDGYTFKTYKVKHNDTTSLSSNNVSNSLVEDTYGNIWAGTWGGGICIYNRKADNFKRISHGADVPGNKGFPSKFVYVLYKDSKNRIWIGTSDEGLILADPSKLTFTQFAHDPANPSSLSNNGVHAITEDDEGKLWIGTLGGGLNQFDPETKQFVRYQHVEDDRGSPANNVVTHVFYDSKKRLWIATSNNTLSLMKDQPGKFIHFRHQPDDPKSIGDFHISAIEENDNKIWIGTDFGLLFYNEEENNFHHYYSRPFDRKGLASNQIKIIYSDKQERMWVGTYNGGLSMFDKSFVKVLHLYTFLNENSLSFNDVSAFLQNDDESILVGTDGGGLNSFDRKTGRFIHYKHDPNNPQSIPGNFVKTILKDKTGKIWVGLWGNGLNIFDRKRQIFIPFRNIKPGDDRLRTDNVTCLTQDNDGFIWVSTWGGGVYKFHPDKLSLENFAFNNGDINSVSNYNAWAIHADSKNNIWVGNSDGVLDLYNRKNGGFIHFNTTPPGENSAGILVIFEDSKGRIWVGLEGGGLKLLDRERGTFKTYNIDAGFPSDYVNSIEEDQHGYLWIGSNNGLSRFDPETGKPKNYGLNYGLQSLQFNRQSSAKLRSGEMIFGGVNGFNIFHPDSLDDSPQEFPIIFTDFQIFNKPVPIGKKGSPLKEHINETSEITLPYHNSVFSLEYAALNFMGPENTRYKYSLKGFVNEDWQEVGTERKVTYTNLDPGTYTFQVKASNYDGLWNEGASLVIHILPPWWKTLVFKVTGLLLVTLVAVTFYKTRIRRIKKINLMLEKLVTERTKALQDANEELTVRESEIAIQNEELIQQQEEISSQRDVLALQNQKLSEAQETIVKQHEEIKNKNLDLEIEVEKKTKELVTYNQQLEQFAFIAAHNLRSPVARILGLGNLLAYASQNPEEEKFIIKKIIATTVSLDTVIKDLNQILEIKTDIHSHLAEVNFSQEIDLIKSNLEREILETQSEIFEHFEAAPSIISVKTYIDSILFNLISNAIKYRSHDRTPCISIRTSIMEDFVCLEVQDNGLGFDLTKYGKDVFSLYKRFHTHTEGKGLGLYLVKMQTLALGGKVEVNSIPGHGSTFKIYFKRH